MGLVADWKVRAPFRSVAVADLGPSTLDFRRVPRALGEHSVDLCYQESRANIF